MENKIYTSFKDIDTDIEILKVEKELSYQKIIWNFQKIKESFTIPIFIGSVLGSYKSILSNSYGTILQKVLPFIIKWLIKAKRGN